MLSVCIWHVRVSASSITQPTTQTSESITPPANQYQEQTHQTPQITPTQETLEGRITKILSQDVSDTSTGKVYYQTLQVYITSGSLKGQTISAQGAQGNNTNGIVYKVDDSIVLLRSDDGQGNVLYYATDYLRRSALYFALLFFFVLTVLVSGKRGISSVLGLVLSFFIIFTFVLPTISNGANPVLIAIAASLIIVPTSFYLSHGFNKKTTSAIIGSLAALVLIGVFAVVFVASAKLTGYGADETMFLSIAKQGTINIKNLMLAGIIIGALGILNDITISQASVVFQLHAASKGELGVVELYKSAMKVGQDHIASMVNTLVLVYTGASLPLLLLFINSPQPFSQVINIELIASEIIKTVVGSVGLILAVPITTIIACMVVDLSGVDTIKRPI